MNSRSRERGGREGEGGRGREAGSGRTDRQRRVGPSGARPGELRIEQRSCSLRFGTPGHVPLNKMRHEIVNIDRHRKGVSTTRRSWKSKR